MRISRWHIGARFEVSMHWKLGDGHGARATARFVAEVKAIDVSRDRLLCRLDELLSLRTSHPPETLDQDLLARIKQLVGKFAYIPPEAADEGKTLPLKLTTLTGQHGYFMDEMPEETGTVD